jgi:hypothetical protein
MNESLELMSDADAPPDPSWAELYNRLQAYRAADGIIDLTTTPNDALTLRRHIARLNELVPARVDENENPA